MKKQNNVYSASDFVGMNSSIIIEDCWWQIDRVDCTTVGEFSKTPLFELQLKQFAATSKLDLPDGFEDASSMLHPSRTYFVREGRPLYNELIHIWEACEDAITVDSYVANNWSKKLLAGHVERLTGVNYTTTSKRGTMISRSKMEVWYPEGFESGSIVDDFIFLCNKGVYMPTIEKTPVDPIAEAISKLDPKIVKAILASNK